MSDIANPITIDPPIDSPEPSHSASYSGPVTVIEPRRGWQSLELDELWRYRHLIGSFIVRDIKAQQKQTVLGMLWIFVSPLVSVVALTVVFGKLVKVPSDGFPYPIFIFAGQMLWDAFSGAVSRTTNSVVSNRHFIEKVYFPRLLIPTSATCSSILNVTIVFACLLMVMCGFGYFPTWKIIFAPLIILLVLATALGIGLWFAPLHVTYRDVGRLVSFFIGLGIYATPVIYPISIVPERFRLLMALNPMAGYITTFRWSLYGGEFHPDLLIASLVTTIFVLVGGAFFFARMQGRFADVI